MKKFFKAFAFAICLTLTTPLFMAGTQIETAEAATKRPKISITRKTIYEGESFKLKVIGSKQRVRWSTSNKRVATVTAQGVVKGIDGGTNKRTCKITGSVGGKKYSCRVTVNGSSLNTTDIVFEEGESRDLWIIGNDQSVTWSSEDESIAVVNGGTVIALSAGRTNIIAATSTKTYRCVVTVTKKVLVTDISVQSSVTMRVGQNTTIFATPIPSNATEEFTPTYTSNNTNIVTVSQNGVITPIASGQTQIVVSFKDIKKTIIVTVQKTKAELLAEEDVRYQQEKQSLQDEQKRLTDAAQSQLNSLLSAGGYYYGTEYDYQKELSEANQLVARYQRRAAILEGDDSNEGQAELRKVKSDLANAQNTVNDLMNRWSRKEQIETFRNTINASESNYQTKLTEIEQKHQQNVIAIQAGI